MNSRPITCSPLLSAAAQQSIMALPLASLSATDPPKKPKCATCSKKLTLSDMTCRCGARFCSVHRLPETHACAYDFRKDALDVLNKQLERVAGEKVQKI